jgi:hypothetical protein
LGYFSAGFRNCGSLIISFPCAIGAARDAAAPATAMPAPPTIVLREREGLLSLVIPQLRDDSYQPPLPAFVSAGFSFHRERRRLARDRGSRIVQCRNRIGGHTGALRD